MGCHFTTGIFSGVYWDLKLEVLEITIGVPKKLGGKYTCCTHVKQRLKNRWDAMTVWLVTGFQENVMSPKVSGTKMEVLYLIRPFWGSGFSLKQALHTPYLLEYLYFRYLKCLGISNPLREEFFHPLFTKMQAPVTDSPLQHAPHHQSLADVRYLKSFGAEILEKLRVRNNGVLDYWMCFPSSERDHVRVIRLHFEASKTPTLKRCTGSVSVSTWS